MSHHGAAVDDGNVAVHRVELIYRRGLRVADGAAVALGDVGNSDRSKNTGSGGAVVNVNQIWDRVNLRDVGGWGAVDNSRIGLNEVRNRLYDHNGLRERWRTDKKATDE